MYTQVSYDKHRAVSERIVGNVPSNEREANGEKSLLIVNSRPLDRECLAEALVRYKIGLKVLNFGSIEDWRASIDEQQPLGAVLFHLGGKQIVDLEETNKLLKLTAELGKIPVVILADSDDLVQVLKALDCGARGYILTSVGIGVCAEALELAMAGGIFIPASCVLAVKHLIEAKAPETHELTEMFTPRQSEVVNALRKGKANKIIAYELRLRESTVKVHIRNIMKKLRATNRTEIVYKINHMYPTDPTFGAANFSDSLA